MDKSVIKNFAVSARVKLKEQIEQKAYTFGITKNEIKSVEMYEDTFEVNDSKYNKRLLKHRESLIEKINEKGFEQVLEEVAYTWFNRLIAIRFMEVNEYLPSGVRVLSSTDSSKVEPDIICEAANLDFESLNIDLIYKLQDENKTDELFKYLLIKQCNELGKIMPVVFEEIEDFTELLLPDNLLQEGSIIRDLVTSITEEDWKEQVEIIGWLYQYYISEKKDEVFADLKKNKKITKENIPAATQLFTPDWIVKYMVENSLGRLWLELHSDEELKSKWKYYLEEAEQEPEVTKQLQVIRGKNKDLKPEDIKVIDCCMGSGHILVYQFDVLFDIYKSAGYSEREIPKLILEKNLYGLDIDDRAAQLAYFAVMMKARSYNRRIFREKIDLNICSIQESNGFPKEAIDFLVNSKETEIEKRIHKDDVEYLINIFNDAKEYGSILEVKEIDFEAIERRLEEIRNGETTDIFEWQYKNEILEKIPALVKQTKIMSQKYDVVCTNPPYMGKRTMNTTLVKYLDNFYKKSSTDIYSVFIDKCINFAKNEKYASLVTQHSWMFLSSFEELRKNIIINSTISSMLHLGPRAFDEISGEVVQTVSFVLRKHVNKQYNGNFIRLVGYNNSREKEKEFFNLRNRYYASASLFENIPGSTISYWPSVTVKNMFTCYKNIGMLFDVKKGMDTGSNNLFVREWFEVAVQDIYFNAENQEQVSVSGQKWIPYLKGGKSRKWYGNFENVVFWKDNGAKIKSFPGSTIRSEQLNYKEGITWTDVGSNFFSGRYFGKGFIRDNRGPAIIGEYQKLVKLLPLLCSKLLTMFQEILNPTMCFQVGNVKSIPVSEELFNNSVINYLSIKNIEISKCDWDSFENSWEFKVHPLLKYSSKKDSSIVLSSVFNLWKTEREEAFQQLKYNEEELNRILIEVYGLQDELTPDVEENDITIRIADRIRDIKSFISYAVGCMLGRYSLDEEGLIYAGGEFNPDRYKTFKVDLDNVIPITDDEYFEDDIVSRFVEFVKITFSEETLEENLDYIADTLGKKGNETSRQAIRRYFLKDFYKDHLQTYQKRPIYWLFDSGKNDGFKALIYMHRYDIGTVARVRTDYLHLLQRKYEAEVNRLDMVMENSNASAREKTEVKKKKEKIQKQILECIQYDQVIAHVANQKISIDLDDGIKVNYAKFQGVEVPQGEGKKPLKADLLAKI